ncbi:hypothetical protein LR48_Vigan715s000800 [Vigna angularis]|uniref:DUF8039 domain-containing protein n=1 Tax=Phaseolus angularis TaxID=3914 RepID=A0A0L9TG05_PHAAN|nr:hypothetical protein LR48_Vigan715s000800 [Vigna angularis]
MPRLPKTRCLKLDTNSALRRTEAYISALRPATYPAITCQELLTRFPSEPRPKHLFELVPSSAVYAPVASEPRPKRTFELGFASNRGIYVASDLPTRLQPLTLQYLQPMFMHRLYKNRDARRNRSETKNPLTLAFSPPDSSFSAVASSSRCGHQRQSSRLLRCRWPLACALLPSPPRLTFVVWLLRLVPSPSPVLPFQSRLSFSPTCCHAPSRLPLSEGDDPLPPPSPPSRHDKWKLARMRPSGSYTSESAREISERIDSLVEQSSQGQFTQEGRQDILATAIGRPEHPGRMKDEIRKEMTQEITKKVRAKLYDEVAEMVARQFQQHYEDYGNRPPPSPVAEHVVPPTVAGALGDDMDDTRPCELYILSDTGTMLVARGTVYETTTVVHGVQLAEDEVKVTVDEVVIADVVLPVPTDEFFTVEEAFRSFVAWPRHLVGHVSNPPDCFNSRQVNPTCEENTC